MKFEELTNGMIEAMREIIPWLNKCRDKALEDQENAISEEVDPNEAKRLQEEWLQEFADRLQEPLKKHLDPQYVDEVFYGYGCIYICNYVFDDGRKVNIFVFENNLRVTDSETNESLEELGKKLDLSMVF